MRCTMRDTAPPRRLRAMRWLRCARKPRRITSSLSRTSRWRRAANIMRRCSRRMFRRALSRCPQSRRRIRHSAPRAQLHETYIVAQTANGIVIVDQHAAHERLVYERMKHAMENGGVARQPLLIPEVVELDPAEVDRVLARAGQLAELGLVVESFGPDAVAVRETPAMLGQMDIKGLLRDLADNIAETGSALSLKER